jgi:hypothetical protein
LASGPLDEQVLAVVQQRAQVRGRPDGQPDRRQARVAGGDPRDGEGVDRVGLALADLGSSFAGGHQRWDLDHHQVLVGQQG